MLYRRAQTEGKTIRLIVFLNLRPRENFSLELYKPRRFVRKKNTFRLDDTRDPENPRFFTALRDDGNNGQAGISSQSLNHRYRVAALFGIQNGGCGVFGLQQPNAANEVWKLDLVSPDVEDNEAVLRNADLDDNGVITARAHSGRRV